MLSGEVFDKRRMTNNRPSDERALDINGIPITPDDASWLVERLYQDGASDAVAAALIIEKGIDRDLAAVDLSRRHFGAILRQLKNPPDGLVELRGMLAGVHAGGQ
jgi:hypothetical protein